AVSAGQQVVALQGIGAGTPAGTQVLSVTASSSNPGLIPNPAVVYTSPNATGELRYTPTSGQAGTATITVTVKDNGGTAGGRQDTVSQAFTVSIFPSATVRPAAG